MEMNGFMGEIMVKTWLLNKMQGEAKMKQHWFDMGRRNEDGTPYEEDGYTSIYAEVERETEKAIMLKIPCGMFGGVDGFWKTWAPKSQIKLVEE
ncbi:hypothetical protein [uncultured Phascolarctobacterium sp.]|uniref:hypothetical protein n=1 Tax=uncultured Phascolarctobacterium sp. TaxID=512296 RepID=UPI0025F3AAFF|nr:hypothetical protein [uncultured Phascolarctobacterium sp.]